MDLDLPALIQLTCGGLGAIIGLGSIAAVARTLSALPILGDLDDDAPSTWPSVSVLIPACDEALSLPGTLGALLGIDYPDLSVVVVDDRSTDSTPDILRALAAAHPRLTTVRIDTLPPGWLGKVHALHCGMSAVTADWVLFMDADVELAPGCLRRAIAHASAAGLDLVSAVPEIRSGGFLADAAFNATALTLGVARLWEVGDPSKQTAASVGAFILVRRAAFEATEGFPWLKLEVADDMALSLLLKQAGRRVALLNGRGQIRLTWYESFSEMQRKMQKNWFGIMGHCSVLRCLAMSLFLLAFPLLPLTQLPAWGLSAPLRATLFVVGAGGMASACLLWAHQTRRPLLTAAVPWLGCALMAWMLLRSAVIGARIGGIEWRGVHYPSAALRAGRRVRF